MTGHDLCWLLILRLMQRYYEKNLVPYEYKRRYEQDEANIEASLAGFKHVEDAEQVNRDGRINMLLTSK